MCDAHMSGTVVELPWYHCGQSQRRARHGPELITIVVIVLLVIMLIPISMIIMIIMMMIIIIIIIMIIIILLLLIIIIIIINPSRQFSHLEQSGAKKLDVPVLKRQTWPQSTLLTAYNYLSFLFCMFLLFIICVP